MMRPSPICRRIAFIVLALLLGSVRAHAQTTINLEWDQHSDTTVVGYTVHVGINPGVYGLTFDVPGRTTTTFSFSQPIAGTRYYFAVSAYDGSNSSSAVSNVVSSKINIGPTWIQPANQTSSVSVATSLQLSATDDGDPLTYSASGLPAGLSIGASTGRISGTPTTVGTYSVTATVSDGALVAVTKFTWVISTSASLTVTGLVSNLPSPQNVGTSTAFTVSTTGGKAPVQYKWTVFNGTTWAVGQNWSTNANFAWTAAAPATYGIAVWARNAGSTADAPDSVAASRSVAFTLTAVAPAPAPAPASAPAPTACVVTPSAVGVLVGPAAMTGTMGVVASGSGCAWTATRSVPWLTIQSANNGTGSGTVTFAVTQNYLRTARSGYLTVNGRMFMVTQGGAAQQRRVYDALTDMNGTDLLLHTPDIASGNWTPWVGVMRVSGNSVTLANGAGATYAGATLATGLSDGSIGVDWIAGARTWGGLAMRVVDGNNFLAVRYSGGRVDLVRIANGAATVVGSGAAVTAVTANQVHRVGARLAGSSITVQWDNVDLFTVTEPFQMTATRHGVVWAPQTDTGGAYDNFEVTTELPADAGLTLTSNLSSPQAAGATITWTGTATGTNTPYSYKWWVFDGVTWRIAQDWSITNAFVWKPTAAGAYTVAYWLRSAGHTADYPERSIGRTFQVNAPTGPASLTVTGLASHLPSPQIVGTRVIFTVSTAGGVGPIQYKWMVFNGATWTVVQNWSTSANLVWAASTAGTYGVAVWARNAGSTADAPDSVAASRSVSYAWTATAPAPPPPTAPTVCVVTPSPIGVSVGPAASTGTISVVANNSGCAWTAARNVSWLTIQGANNGTGSGTLTFTVTQNYLRTARSGLLTVNGRTVVVTQSSAAQQRRVYDTLTDMNGTDLLVHTPDLAAGNWTPWAGTMRTSSNTLTLGSGAGATYAGATLATGLSDGSVAADWLAGSGAWGGLAMRVVDGNNFLAVRYSGGRVDLVRIANGATTVVGSGATVGAVTAGQAHRLGARLTGSSITVQWDNMDLFTVTEPFQMTATRHGVVWAPQTDPGAAYDNFEVTTELPADTGLTLTSTLSSPQAAGATITWTGTATGTNTPYSYKWWVFDGTTWLILQNWSTTNTFVWRPTRPGTYTVAYWLRSAGDPADYPERSITRTFTVQ